MHLPVHPQTAGCCTRERIGPTGVVDEAGQHAMEASDRSRTRGIIEMPPRVLDLPQVGEVKATPEVGKERPWQNFGIVTGRVTKRASVGKSETIQTKPD